MVAAAVIGGSIGGALISSAGSKSAANTQAAAANQATDEQTMLASAAMNNANSNNAPYKQAGSTALSQIGGLLNLPGYASVNPSSYLSSLPGYQFQLQQGENAINNASSAGSGAINSATMTGLNNYAQGQAQSSYGTYLGQLGGLAQMGQASANNLTTAGSNIFGNLANQVGSNTIGAGNAQAAGTVGTANALSSGLSNASGYSMLGNLGIGNQMSGAGAYAAAPGNTYNGTNDFAGVNGNNAMSTFMTNGTSGD